MSHVLIFNASPRKKGNSSIMIDQFIKGLNETSHTFELFDLNKMNIRPCQACEGCVKLDKKGCIQKDDLVSVYPKLISADAIVFATPIYWFTYAAQLKLLIDRFYAIYHPSEGFRLKNKPFLVMMVYGDEDVYSSGAINAIRSFEDAFRFCKISNYEFIYGSGPNLGDITKNEPLMQKIYEKGKNLI